MKSKAENRNLESRNPAATPCRVDAQRLYADECSPAPFRRRQRAIKRVLTVVWQEVSCG